MSDAAPKIRILLVDDQTLLREGFRRLIELEGDDLLVVASATNGLEAIAAIERMELAGQLPDVVLMDIRMPQLDGVQATARLHQRWPAVRVMMLTTFDDEAYVVEGLRAGAKGYLLKDASVQELVAAIRAIHHGESPLQPAVAAKLVAHISREPAAPAITPPAPDIPYADELTEREREILRYLAQGASNREISEALFITEGTVKNHVSNVLNKLGLRDRTQAAIYAREHGLI